MPAIATVDGKTYQNVGVHFRGASSFMMVPEGSKRSLNLTFDFVDEKQALYSYRTLNLLNANGDPTFVRAVVYSEIARQYIPTPRANYMRVVINGESWGVYVNAQQFNKDFTRDYLQEHEGRAVEGPRTSRRPRRAWSISATMRPSTSSTYEIKSKDDGQVVGGSRPPLQGAERNAAPTSSKPPSRRSSTSTARLKFLALDVALVNSDGYWTRASDYSIYQDEKGRFHVIPHDMNEGLADEGGRGFGPGARWTWGPGWTRGPGGPGGPGGQAGAGAPGGAAARWQFGPGRGRGGRGMFGAPATAELDPLVGLDDRDQAAALEAAGRSRAQGALPVLRARDRARSSWTGRRSARASSSTRRSSPRT